MFCESGGVCFVLDRWTGHGWVLRSVNNDGFIHVLAEIEVSEGNFFYMERLT